MALYSKESKILAFLLSAPLKLMKATTSNARTTLVTCKLIMGAKKKEN
jgi:hypothetical protein